MARMLFEEALKSLVVLTIGCVFGLIGRVIMIVQTGEVRRCMIPGCSSAASQRGLCLKCYSRAKAKVDAGETTWDKLIERGLCEAVKDPFDDAYTRAMEDN